MCRRFLKKQDGRPWTGFIWLRKSGGLYEHGNEPWESLNCEEFLDWLDSSYFNKRDCFMELVVVS
jgi:hypothetical protein